MRTLEKQFITHRGGWLVFGLACLLPLSGCQTCPRDKATEIATAAYPGRNQINECKIYADAVCKEFARNNIPAWRVWYFRNNKFGPCGHAIVVYKDAGAYWCVDNEFPTPSKCWGTTPKEWAQERDAMWLTDGGNLNMPVNFGNANQIVAVSAVDGRTLLAKAAHGEPGRAMANAGRTQQRGRRKVARTAGKSASASPLAGRELSTIPAGRKLTRRI